MYFQRLSSTTALIATLGCSIFGAVGGLALGSLGDTVLHIDSRIFGVVAGATLGSLLMRHAAIGSNVHAAAAGISVFMPTIIQLVLHRAAPEVVAGMITTAIVCSGLLHVVRIRLESRKEA